MKTKNPHSICTWDDGQECSGCEIDGKLMCKSDKSFRKQFILRHLTFRATAFLGLIIIGAFLDNWWLTIAYAIPFVLNFTILEPRLLCSHCPFYADDGRVLRCNTLYGLPKLWKYRPGPITRPEKILQLIIGGIVDLYPILAFIYGIVALFINSATSVERITMIGITIILIMQMIDMNNTLQNDVCTKCPNFSCAMSKTPKSLRDAYIRRNPVMKEAWEKAGYKFDE